MLRKYIPGAILTLGVTGALVYFYGGSRAPSGQFPLQRITPQNVGGIKGASGLSR
jgi:hypothetical protein